MQKQTSLTTYQNLDQIMELEARQRRVDVFDQIVALEHTATEPLKPFQKNIPEQPTSVLAIRDDINQFGIVQVLHSVVRVGSYGFGIASIYGAVPMPGQQYITRINEDTHNSDLKMFMGILSSKKGVLLDAKNPLTPELGHEAVALSLRRTKKGKVEMQAILPVEVEFSHLFAKERAAEDETGYDPLANEIGIWAPDPRYVRKALLRASTNKIRHRQPRTRTHRQTGRLAPAAV